MSRSFIHSLVALVGLSAAARAEDACGLLVFKSSSGDPDDLAHIVRFSEAEKGPRFTEYSPEENEERFRLLNDQLVTLIPFPSLKGATLKEDSQFEELRELSEEMKRTANRFPATLEPLAEPYREVRAALENFENGMVLVAGKWKEPNPSTNSGKEAGETLRITLADGSVRTYDGVELMRVEGANFIFKHSGGVAQGIIDALSPADRERIGIPSELIASTIPTPNRASPFVGVWTHEATNFFEPFARLRAFDFQADGTLVCYARRSDEEPWAEWFTSTWEAVERQFVDTKQSYLGAEIAGSLQDWSYQQLGIIYVLAGENLIAASNVDAMRKSTIAVEGFSDVLLSQTGRRISSSDTSPKNPWSKLTKIENFTP